MGDEAGGFLGVLAAITGLFGWLRLKLAALLGFALDVLENKRPQVDTMQRFSRRMGQIALGIGLSWFLYDILFTPSYTLSLNRLLVPALLITFSLATWIGQTNTLLPALIGIAGVSAMSATWAFAAIILIFVGYETAVLSLAFDVSCDAAPLGKWSVEILHSRRSSFFVHSSSYTDPISAKKIVGYVHSSGHDNNLP